MNPLALAPRAASARTPSRTLARLRGVALSALALGLAVTAGCGGDKSPHVVKLSGGVDAFCAATQAGEVYCWGGNSVADLAARPGDLNRSLQPRRVDGVAGASEVAGGNGQCVVGRDGTVQCWGFSSCQTMSGGSVVMSYTPVAIAGLTDVAHVEYDGCAACAMRRDGSVWCWGAGFGAQPRAVDPLAGAQSLSIGQNDVYAVRADGTVAIFQAPDTFTPVDGAQNATEVVADFNCACARTSDGGVSCWGRSDAACFAPSAGPAQMLPPTPVAGLTGVAHLRGRASHFCAVLTSGGLTCWGANASGELAPGADARIAPTPVAGVADALDVEFVSSAMCVLSRDGTVQCAGDNSVGQLGDGTMTSRGALSPVAWPEH